jgi:glycosyltransferase involved in cell wall biosynthesis
LANISGNTNIRVLYNPTILRKPVYEDDTFRREHEEESVHFLFMGRLGQRKGVYDIIESARQLKENRVQIHLYGDGEIDQVQKAVEDSGVSDIVKVRGWIDGSRKDQTFQESNVLLLPSYNEGLPISVLEAMAYGLPVVATDVGGVAEAVENGVNGYLLNPGETEKLAHCIKQLADSRELRLSMGKEGYALAREKFDLPVIVRQLETLYDELAAK